MNKAELIREIALAAGISKLAAKSVIETITSSIRNDLVRGEPARLTGFGTFYVGKREARIGRNPSTGATVKIKAANSPKFRAGEELKASLKETGVQFSRHTHFRDSASGKFLESSGAGASPEQNKTKKKRKGKGGSDNTGPKVEDEK